MSNEGAVDLVFVNGPVHTGDATRRRAGAVAVRDGRIVAVGTGDEVLALRGPGTEVVDLTGRLLVPGFQDAHVHAGVGGLELLRCNLAGLASREEYAAVVARYAADHPEADWITGGGWTMEAFPGGVPDRELLDGVVPDRPAFLPNRDHHSAWVNTKAMELAGIDAGTPDPTGGRIERDADGRPSGALHESAMELVGALVPEPTAAELRAGLLAGQAHLHSFGITGWQDAIVGESMVGPDFFDTYVDLAASGDLTGRVVGAQWWRQGRGEEQLDRLIERRARALVGRFRADSVKIMQDGVAETFTAAMLDPYLDVHGCSTGNRGMSFVDPVALRGYVTRLDAEGFQVHVHALGDRAIRETFDAIELARATNGSNDLRHHLAHIQVIHPDDLPRFRTLGVVANFQPLWACNEPQMTELTVPFLGPERVAQQYPIATIEGLGGQLAFGSDWPVSSPNVMRETHVAVNRTMPGGTGIAAEPLLPGERLPLSAALHAFTMGSAYVNHLDMVTGSIEVGKYADLAVLDRDPFAAPPEEIWQTQVQQTFVEGIQVYNASDA
ncbi:MAG: amidohydrolase [Streptosporangiales bacterium]